MSIFFLCWFLLIGVFGLGNIKYFLFLIVDLGVYIFFLFFNLLVDVLYNIGVNDLDFRLFDFV